MRRFFTTFLLLAGVSISLIISDNYFKVEKNSYTAENSKRIENTTGFEKSIDLTEADIFQSKSNTNQVSLPN